MQKVKYGVWFHGNEDEPEGICYQGRTPYIVDEKNLAIEHMVYLQNVCDETDEDQFSICTITIAKDQHETL